mmetsp:Transcript_54161/g.142600  ORF Transcript_54161/g.142600 Transcript_54161/m.142600 type:complete len:93 (+) Transcript_54161:239-517(+)
MSDEAGEIRKVYAKSAQQLEMYRTLTFAGGVDASFNRNDKSRAKGLTEKPVFCQPLKTSPTLNVMVLVCVTLMVSALSPGNTCPGTLVGVFV